MRILKTAFFIISILVSLTQTTKAQESIGMSTGNYSGVTSIWFNPANIADSRYKFDINLVGINSYFNNNYLLVKNGTIVRRLFFKEPYNSSFDSVKSNLIQEQLPVDGKVYGTVENNIHFPLSFMATTGKRSAIALTLNNRTIQRVDNMPVELARSFYGELQDPALHNIPIRADSMQYNFLNWQEVGLTYSRVMLTTKHHMLKIGFTGKWLGANAAAYMQTDNATVTFQNETTMSLQSPLIHYARTKNADLGQFNRRDLFNNLEDQTFGWDAGLVYEFRARVNKFKYLDEDQNTKSRRDMNKYMFRIGISVVDMGKFKLQKRALTNDHSANITNWDFSNVNASNLSDWDTAYAKQVVYDPNAPTTFTYRLPAAMIANFDLHLFGGFYINAAAKAPFESFKKKTDTYIAANSWVAITPRFEGKFLGIYVPIIRANKRTNVGATLKFGPFYLGSNNLAQLLSNKSTYEGDFHAGVRLSIPYGKPTRFKAMADKVIYGEETKTPVATQTALDSLKRELDYLKKRVYDSSSKQPIQVIINNDGVNSQVERHGDDSIVIRGQVSPASLNAQNQQQTASTDNRRRQEILADTLSYQLARANVELNRTRKELENSKVQSNKKDKKEKKSSEPIKVETNNKEIEKELERIRKQNAIQNAALIGGGAATVAVVASDNDKKKKDSTVKNDSALNKKVTPPAYAPVVFESGSIVLSESERERIKNIAQQLKNNPTWHAEIIGVLTSTTNQNIATSRSNAVADVFLQQAVSNSQFQMKSQPAEKSNTIPAASQNWVLINVHSH